MPTDDLDRFCCQNPDCPLQRQRGAGNLSVCGHFGKAAVPGFPVFWEHHTWVPGIPYLTPVDN